KVIAASKQESQYYVYGATGSGKGEHYADVLPTIHIGILSYTLFSDFPEFYAQNLLMNVKKHRIYSDKFALNVLDLKSIKLATTEDKACKLDYWAKLFKATTWEEIQMLAEQNDLLQEAAVTMRELTADEKIRLQCEARERYERDQRSMFMTGQIKQKEIEQLKKQIVGLK
ncbi:MAG: hypothetical protein GX567_18500, partial [Clostridia bacterium]|nr:hypothetical protein [Clostridia bacterium]